MNKIPGSKFEDIYTYTKTLTKLEKGTLFEHFTYYLFQYDPMLSANLENIWMYSQVPPNILRDLKLPKTDKGIDLIAKIDGEFYAIQCKFRQNPNITIKWGELSTFFGLSFGITDNFKGGILVTNTYNLCNEVLVSDKVQSISGVYFDDLSKKIYQSIKMQDNKVVYKRKYPLGHQRLCVMYSQAHFLENSNGYIEMACGSGKTLTSYWIDKSLLNTKTVVFVPSLNLLSQFYSDWIKQSSVENINIKFLLIGSDVDVDIDNKDKKIMCKSNGLFLCTDPMMIKNNIKKNQNSKIVVICTYQSAVQLKLACRNKIIFDFAIFDESHRTVGQKNKQFSLMLENKNLGIRKRLFMTATPKIYSGSIEKPDIVSMNNENIYGKMFYRYSTGDAIKDKRLVDYQVISLYVKNADIHKLIKQHRLVGMKKTFKDVDSNYLGTAILLLKKIHDGTCTHLLTYHNKIKNAVTFAMILNILNNVLYNNNNNNVFITHLDSTHTIKERNNVIREFNKQPKAIVCSSRILIEGINIPIVDSVCFVDPKFSTIDITQCIGRSLRLCENKKLAHIIVPIFIENFDDELSDKNYGNILRILKTLKSTDERIIEYFKLKQNEKINNAIVVHEYYNEKQYSKEIKIFDWINCINEKIWCVVETFTFKYKKLQDWVKKNKRIPRCRRNKKYIEEIKLAQWCISHKNKYKKKSLSQEKIILFEKIKGWIWVNDENDFNVMYTHVIKWVCDNNKFPSEAKNKSAFEKKLARWCGHKRNMYLNKKLLPHQIEKLNKIKGWWWSRNGKENFMLQYNELVKWVKDNNKIPTVTINETEKKLSYWLNRIKEQKKYNKLPQYQIDLLNKLPGFKWRVPINNEEIFNTNYNLVYRWVLKNNKFPRWRAENEDERKLYYWVLRNRKNKSTLSIEKQKLLLKIPGWKWFTIKK